MSIIAGMPFGQLPVLEEDGKVIHQSVAMARYAAKKVKLVGEDDWENLEIDAIADTINDFRLSKKKVSWVKICVFFFFFLILEIGMYAYEQNEEVKATRKTQLEQETIPYYLEKFENIAKDNNGHFALGKLTWADFFFAGILDYMNYMIGKDLIADYPNLKQVVENVNSIPTVKAWIESRPQTDL